MQRSAAARPGRNGNEGKALCEACAHWRELEGAKHAPGWKSDIKDHTQLNQYIRDLLSDRPDLSMDDVRRFWSRKIQRPSRDGCPVLTYPTSTVELTPSWRASTRHFGILPLMKYLLPLLLAAAPALADPAQVVGVEATTTSNGWRFDVTIAHGDTGWDDYADGWRVELADGTVIGERPLAHPHVEEQPFTRATSGIAIPDGTTQVFIRARTNVDGWAEDTTAYDLPR